MNNEKLNKNIDSIKEVLSNMPQNNKKNKLKYLNYIKENLDNARDIEKNIIHSLTNRNDEIIKRIGTQCINFSDKENEMNQLLEKIFIINKWNTPYEKINLDKTIYAINHYYKDNLEALNNDIKDALKCFQKVGIKLKSKDFKLSKYVYQYMDVMLSEDSSKVSSKMDELFWKSPNMIHSIAMNFNYLYIKNEKYFINYYKNLNKEINNSNDILEKYNKLSDDCNNSKYLISTIYNKFINGELNVKDYSMDKLNNYISTLGINKLNMDTLNKLYDSLNEYKTYKEYKFIIDKVIELYKNKTNYKNCYKNLIKDMNKIYSKIFKINRKLNNKWLHNSEKEELLEIKLNNTLEELREKDTILYQEKVNEIISILNDNTSYYDALNLIGFNYTYFRKVILEVNEDMKDEDIIQSQEKLKTFLCSKKISFLENVNIVDEVNIPQIIADRYKLLNINISEDEIENNPENYMDAIEKVTIINTIENSNISYDELQFLVNIKDIIKK